MSDNPAEVCLVETNEPDIQRACPVGSQLSMSDNDTYYAITRIVQTDDIYRIYGTPIVIPELADVCVSCERPLSDDDDLDEQICNACFHEAMQHRPQRYARISLEGYSSYIQPLDQIETAINGEMDGAEIGTKLTIEIIEMTPAEYAALPEFQGH
jgi:hypothetical protein